METQIINDDKKAKNNGKYDNLKKGAALAGAAVAGAGAMYGAEVLMNEEGEMELDVPIVDIDPATIPDPTDQEAAEAAGDTTVEPSAAPEGPAPQDTPVSHTGGHTAQASDTHVEEPVSLEEVNDIAQEITGEDFIDPTDIDAPNLDIASIGTITTADGQELAAAQILSDTGDELYVVDVDNDDVYDIVADASGNMVGEIGSLTVGDAEAILTENAGETGFLADNGNDGITDDLLSGIETDIMDVNG